MLLCILCITKEDAQCMCFNEVFTSTSMCNGLLYPYDCHLRNVRSKFSRSLLRKECVYYYLGLCIIFGSYPTLYMKFYVQKCENLHRHVCLYNYSLYNVHTHIHNWILFYIIVTVGSRKLIHFVMRAIIKFL